MVDSLAMLPKASTYCQQSLCIVSKKVYFKGVVLATVNGQQVHADNNGGRR